MGAMQRLELRQGQSLTMTPQLVQSIKLLQLSHAELAAYVEAELERNPLLQEGETPADAPVPSLADFLRAKQRAEAAGPRMVPGPPPSRSEAVPASSGQPAGSGHSELKPEMEAMLAQATSLAGHLEAQLDLATADPRLRSIGEHLIHNLDEAGYLTEDLAEIAARLQVAPAEIEAALGLIQTFEPSGIGARNLAECLAIQLKERDRLDPAMQALLAHLHLVARQDFAALQKVCGVDREDLADMLSELRSLEPKPGLAFTPAPIHVLVADVLVRPAADGSFAVELNPDTLPRILLNRSYYARSGEGRAQGRGQELPVRLPADRELAHPQPRPARQDDPEGGGRDRPPAGGLLSGGRLRPAPDDPQKRGGSDRDARIHDLARHREQGHRHRARHASDEVLLQRRHRERASIPRRR